MGNGTAVASGEGEPDDFEPELEELPERLLERLGSLGDVGAAIDAEDVEQEGKHSDERL